MSYPLDLDEYPDERLIAELNRRQDKRASGSCAYCGYKADHSDFPNKDLRYDNKCLRPEIGITRVLTLDRLRAKNTERLALWHDRGEPWSGADWGNAMQGEGGELVEAAVVMLQLIAVAGNISNTIKKIRRHETGLGDSANTPELEECLAKLRREFADFVIYADLTSAHYGVDLTGAVIEKFNETSDINGFEVKL